MVSTWLKDFVQLTSTKVQPAAPSSYKSVNLQSTVDYPLLHTVDFHHLSQDFVLSLLSVLQVPEPHTYSQAKDIPEWIAAIEQELAALEANGTWQLATLPPHKKALTSKWVYKVKYRPDGSIERYKAQLVIRGFQQVKDKDYKHTFSSVAKLTIVRVFYCFGNCKGLAFAPIRH